METAALGEILVIPFFGQGHLFPCMELCVHFASHNFKAVFIIPSNLSSSVPSTFDHHPFIEVVEVPNPSPPPPQGVANGSGTTTDPGSGAESWTYSAWHSQHNQGAGPDFSDRNAGPGQGRSGREPGSHPPWHRPRRPLVPGLESFLSERYANSGQTRPACVVIDVMMDWSRDIFGKLDTPVVSFFTSGACTSAMEYAKWKANADDMKPGDTRILPGLPEDMALSYTDVKRHYHRMSQAGRGRPDRPGPEGGPPGQRRFSPPEPSRKAPGPEGGPPGQRRFGPPEPGRKAPWWEQAEGSIALLFNTCDDLDGPFISYITNQIGKPVWGVGPMLPEQYWESAGSIIHDHEVRSNKESSVTEDEVLKWLDSKPRKSVLYVSFGSEVGPTLEEYAELANALEESNRPFIWVIQPGSGTPRPPVSLLGQRAYSVDKEEGYYPDGLEGKVGERGLIIKGWAPQLLILSHPSLGGFLSHCGWNSTIEAVGRGVPILAWPIRGDQFYNAKLVVNNLKIGHTLLTSDDPFATMKKEEIKQGIDMFMDDEGVHKQAMVIGYKFQHGFPASSGASLKAFVQLLQASRRS